MTEHLGKTVRDRVSQLVGIADQYVEFLSGTKQYAIQPAGDGKTMPDGYSFDVGRIEVVEGPTIDPTPSDHSVVVQLGDKVRDVVTGHEGVTLRRTTFINGCVYFDVAGNVKSPLNDKDPGILFCDHGRLEVVKAGWFREKTAAKVGLFGRKSEPALPATPSREPPGGPTARARRQ